MTRKEKIKEWAEEFSSLPDYQAAYMCGAIRADEHPKNPWRDAKKDPPKREIGNKICYTFLDTAIDGVHEQRYYHYAEFKKYGLGNKGWIDEDGNRVLVEIADYWMPIPELTKVNNETPIVTMTCSGKKKKSHSSTYTPRTTYVPQADMREEEEEKI